MTAPLTTRLVAAGTEATAEAARILTAGGLVAFPTETVYGLGADATTRRLGPPRATAGAGAGRGVSHPKEARQTAALGLEGIDRKARVAASAGMSDMVLAAAERALHPRIEQIEGQG